jgi:hypothetical protein
MNERTGSTTCAIAPEQRVGRQPLDPPAVGSSAPETRKHLLRTGWAKPLAAFR